MRIPRTPNQPGAKAAASSPSVTENDGTLKNGIPNSATSCRVTISRAIYKVCHDMSLGIGGKKTPSVWNSNICWNTYETTGSKRSPIFAQPTSTVTRQNHTSPSLPQFTTSWAGIRVDRSHRTSPLGLYAAGECASQYHGANRLGGNSTLAAAYGGRIAAVTARMYPRRCSRNRNR